MLLFISPFHVLHIAVFSLLWVTGVTFHEYAHIDACKHRLSDWLSVCPVADPAAWKGFKPWR